MPRQFRKFLALPLPTILLAILLALLSVALIVFSLMREESSSVNTESPFAESPPTKFFSEKAFSERAGAFQGAFHGKAEGAKSFSDLAAEQGRWEDVLPVEEAFNFGQVSSDEAWTVFWQVLPGYYLYRDKIRVTSAGQTFALTLPEGKLVDDPTFGRVKVLEGYVELKVSHSFMERAFMEKAFTESAFTEKVFIEGAFTKGAAEESGLQTLEVHWQGCAVKGYCYPPQKETLARP